MSVILASPNQKIAMAAPGRPMLAAPQPGTAPGSGGTASLASVPGLDGWWDAGTSTGVLSPEGVPLTAFGASAGSVADKSLAGTALTVWHRASGGTPPLATGHLSGLLGGVGLNLVVPPNLPQSGQQLPVMDPDQGLVSAVMPFGSNAPWTVLLVWSRPNWRQNSIIAPSALLSIGGIQVLAADNSTGSGQLVLFPGARQTVLTSSLTRRHTHAVILRNTPGVGVDAWLDSTLAAAAAPNPLASSLVSPLLLLHNGATTNGGAECWFHEAAVWGNAVNAAGIAAIQSYLARWTLGPRKGMQILVTGQSNAGNGLNDGAWHLLAQGVAWHLGALAFGVTGSYGSPPAATCIHGEGIYPIPAVGLNGSFLLNPNDGSDPSTWALGTDGLAVRTWVQSNTAPADAADIAAILWPWSEDDCTRQYSEKATYGAAARRFLALERGALSRTAASLPQVWWSAIPFAYNNNDAGTQMQREVVAEMAADPAQNVVVAMPQTADSLPRAPGSFDPLTGLWTGGDSMHRDAVDNQRFGRLAAPLVARAVLAAGGGDTVTTIPVGVPVAGGPVVTHVQRQSATILIVTVQHDCGTDLIVPVTQAASGAGWAVLDGGSVASPGRVVTASGCVRLNATQLQVTLASGLANASPACRLFYPYGTGTIGRGNVVTDNLSLIPPPAGWNIAAELGSGWSLNMPVHVPMTASSGVPLSDASG